MSDNDPPQYIDRWKNVNVLGEGAFGQVYCVHEKNDKTKTLYALKVEKKQKNRNDEVLRMEIRVLEHVQGKFFCKLFDKGETDKMTFIVITLLGKPLDDIRRAQPARHFSAISSLKIGMQMFRAFKKLHFAGYIHRDVKPANMAPGYHHPNMVYLFDFGLSRYIFEKNEPGKLREPRRKVAFRGTYRYCSVNAHKCLDQGRVDDLWGLLYTLIELCTGTLPWTGVKQIESLSIKMDTSDDELFSDCPHSFKKVKKLLSQYKFKDPPDHNALTFLLYKNIQAISSSSLSDPFEWQEHPEQMDPFSRSNNKNEDDENDTVGTVESEYDSDYEGGAGESSTMTRTVDDTLDDLNEENLKEKAKQWEEQKKLKKAATGTSQDTKKGEKVVETKKGEKVIDTKKGEKDSKRKKSVKEQKKPQEKPSKRDGKNQTAAKGLKSQQVKFEGGTKGSSKK